MVDYWSNLRALLHMPPRPSDKASYEFIGEDGSMGLRRYQVVPLSVYFGNGRLWACWEDLADFLAAFSIAVALIALAYMGILVLAQ